MLTLIWQTSTNALISAIHVAACDDPSQTPPPPPAMPQTPHSPHTGCLHTTQRAKQTKPDNAGRVWSLSAPVRSLRVSGIHRRTSHDATRPNTTPPSSLGRPPNMAAEGPRRKDNALDMSSADLKTRLLSASECYHGYRVDPPGMGRVVARIQCLTW